MHLFPDLRRVQSAGWSEKGGMSESGGYSGACKGSQESVCSVSEWNFNDGWWLGASSETSVLGAAELGRLGVLGETDEELIQRRRALISSSYFHIVIRQLLFPLNERWRGLWVTGLRSCVRRLLGPQREGRSIMLFIHPVPVQHYFH